MQARTPEDFGDDVAVTGSRVRASLTAVGCALALLAGSALASCSVPRDQRASAPAATGTPTYHPQWHSVAPFGSWQDHGFDVANNEWNKSEAGPQLIWANSFHQWGVASTQPPTRSVKTYPCVQANFKNPPLTSFTKLTSTFAESMPSSANVYAEAAYDIWLNYNKVEVMIWVDNHGEVPLGRVLTHIQVGTQEFTVWQSGPNMFSFVLGYPQETTGQVDILSFFQWLVSHRFLSDSDTMTQVNFGWEISSTDGVSQNFEVRNYSLSASFVG